MFGSTILLVEDDLNDINLMLLTLQKLPFAVKTVVAQDGIAAIDYLENCPAQALPRLILLDLNLPRLDGLAVMHQLRRNARTRRIPIVILSATAEPETILRSYHSGANSYLRKPVNAETWQQMVPRLCRYWLQLNELPPAQL